MISTARSLVIAATLLGAATAVRAQQPASPQAVPAVADPPGGPTSTPPSFAADRPGPEGLQGYTLPTPEQALAPADNLAGVLIDPPGQPKPGWFVDIEKAGVAIHFNNHLTAAVPVNSTRTDVLRVRSAPLDWGFSPGVIVGYRDPTYPCEYLVAYHYLAAQGTSNVAGLLGSTHLRSRLDQSVLDADYAERVRLADGWDLRWLAGIRTAFVYLDTQATAPSAAAADLLGTAVQQRASDFFVGAGPHAGLDLFRKLPVPGLALYARGDASSVWGSPHQTFSETFGPGQAALLGTSGASTDNQAAQLVWTLGGQVGLSWAPPGWTGKQLFAGYQILEWWRVGMDSVTGSRGDMTQQGVFLRGEIVF